jgi:type IV secretory pathway VirB10-like protein
MEDGNMLENIRLKPEGISKIKKNMVVGLLCGVFFIAFVAFGIGLGPKKSGAAQNVQTTTNPEIAAEVRDKVNLESFDKLPKNYQEQMRGIKTGDPAQNGQPSTYMDPTMPGMNNGQRPQQPYQYGFNGGDPRYGRTQPYDPYNQVPNGGGGGQDSKKQALDEARKSKIFFSAASTPARVQQTAPSAALTQLPNMLQMPPGIMLAQAPGGQEPYTDQARKRAFLDESKKSDEAIYLEHSIQEPASPYQVMAGTVLPAVLITGINSDLPGQIIAQIRENVYDSVSGKYLLIPQGTKLIGTYDNQISWGQNRVMQVWTRMIFPDGSSILLNGMQGTDLAGYAGANDKVNYHYARIGGAVLLSTFLSVGARQAGGNNSEGNYPTTKQQMAGEAASGFNQAGQKFLDRELNIAPTIEIRPGYKFNVMVNRDMILRPYSLQ